MRRVAKISEDGQLSVLMRRMLIPKRCIYNTSAFCTTQCPAFRSLFYFSTGGPIYLELCSAVGTLELDELILGNTDIKDKQEDSA